MIQRWLYLISFAALLLCAGCCCHSRNLSAWGHSPQTAVPLDSPTLNPQLDPLSNTPPPSNPPNLSDAYGNVVFTLDGDRKSPTGWSYLHDDLADLWPEIKQDYRNYYSWDNFEMLLAGFGTAALIANSQSDRELREQYQEHVRGPTGNNFSAWCKEFGNGGMMIPVMAAGWLGGDMLYDWPAGSFIGQWGERSMRSLLVGAAHAAHAMGDWRCATCPRR